MLLELVHVLRGVGLRQLGLSFCYYINTRILLLRRRCSLSSALALVMLPSVRTSLGVPALELFSDHLMVHTEVTLLFYCTLFLAPNGSSTFFPRHSSGCFTLAGEQLCPRGGELLQARGGGCRGWWVPIDPVAAGSQLVPGGATRAFGILLLTFITVAVLFLEFLFGSAFAPGTAGSAGQVTMGRPLGAQQSLSRKSRRQVSWETGWGHVVRGGFLRGPREQRSGITHRGWAPLKEGSPILQVESQGREWMCR